MKRTYDSTVARIAGNILSGNAKVLGVSDIERDNTIRRAVAAARAIVAEVERTEPQSEGKPGTP